MALVKWTPETRELEPFRGLRHEVDRLFDEFVRDSPLRQMTRWFAPEGGYYLHMDLEETAENFILTAEVPGVAKKDLDVNITEVQIVIKGERKTREQEKETAFLCKEMAHGAFERIVELPAPILPDKAVAKVEDGMLTLTLPKAEPSKRKIVKVKIE